VSPEETQTKRILVCGSRDFTDEKMLWAALDKQGHNTVIIHGGARGADKIAAEWARFNSLSDVQMFRANWNLYGKRAGYVRNKQMLEEGKPTLVLAFYKDAEAPSKGTQMMVDLATKAGVKVRKYSQVPVAGW